VRLSILVSPRLVSSFTCSKLYTFCVGFHFDHNFACYTLHYVTYMYMYMLQDCPSHGRTNPNFFVQPDRCDARSFPAACGCGRTACQIRGQPTRQRLSGIERRVARRLCRQRSAVPTTPRIPPSRIILSATVATIPMDREEHIYVS
jgi:hypothetical protein